MLNLPAILTDHKLWLSGNGGKRADLSWADLSWANLSRADLAEADLSGADLSEADLSWADLSWADLSGANLSWANLSRADLSGANLFRADLSGANLISGGLRSDGHAFFLIRDANNLMVSAGCRYFTIAEAREHWTKTRADTRLGNESLAIVDHLERMAKIAGWMETTDKENEP